MDKRGFFAVFILLVLCLSLFLFSYKHVGFVSISVPSSIAIDPGIRVIYSEFSGSTTDFISFSDEELEDIENLTLENPQHGKIIFLESINLTEDVSGGEVNVDEGANISHNRVEVESSVLQSLNKGARIYLYNLNFNSPRALKDGVLCDECNIVGYAGGTFIFDVDGFSVYSAEETPVEIEENDGSSGSGGTGGSGGGSGGSFSGSGGNTGIITRGADFSFDRNPLIVKIKQGQTKREFFRITNTGNEAVSISLSVDGVSGFILLDSEGFSLQPGEYKDVAVDFFAREFEKADIYTGRINAKASGITKSTNVILEIEQRNPLFDITVDLQNYEVSLEGVLDAIVKMVNVGDLKKVDVVLSYFVKNYKDEVIFFKEETLAVDKSLIIERKFRLKPEVIEGDYVFYVKLNYQTEVATSAVPFKVVEKNYNRIYIAVIAIILGVILFFVIKRRNRYVERKKSEEFKRIVSYNKQKEKKWIR